MTEAAATYQRASAPAGGPIRVLVVDDSSVIRGVVSRWIEASSETVLAGLAVNGADAVRRASLLKPDIIVLDIEMPEMDGLAALPLLLKSCPQARIIMASTLTRRNAEISLKALSLGASDYVPKPTAMNGTDAAEDFKRELFNRILGLGRRARAPGATLRATGGGVPSPSDTSRPGGQPGGVAGRSTYRLQKPSLLPAQILAIGSSTGGPQALTRVISSIAADVTVPVLVTQHMPPAFTSILAESLARASGLTCLEAEAGMMLERRCVYVAPGDYHMTIRGRAGPIELSQGPAENFCRPAVDPMMRSVAAAYGPHALGVILTGMGSDGREGARAIVVAGGTIIAQDEDSSVVWGMPGAVANAGLAAAIVPLDGVAAEIKKHLGLRTR
jgi:two-component system chemotaxis response regulator CheB